MIGPAVAELKHLDDTTQLLDVAARVLARAQVELPGANFSLAEQDGVETCTRITVRADRPGVAILHRTQLHLPYRKASSILFLAYGTPAERERFFTAYPFAEHGAPLWGTEQRLRAFFQEVVRKGYSSPDFPDEGYFRVAAPVLAPEGRVIAAAGGYRNLAEGPRQRRRLLTLTVAAAKEISAQIAEDLAIRR